MTGWRKLERADAVHAKDARIAPRRNGMSWEQRKGGGSYYTRSYRQNGRIVREYVGGGDLGRLAAKIDHIGVRTRRLERRELALERARIRALEDAIGELNGAVDLAITCEYVAAGFHRHDRGPWRRRRASR